MQNSSLGQEPYLWDDVEDWRTQMRGFENGTVPEGSTSAEEENDYVFDRMGVRIPFIIAYSIVFCCCVFCNLMVIVLVILNRRLKSTTNFFLTNLAFADLCVGIFCVLQNLTFYLISSWVFGDFLCKMNQFIHGLSCTASIFILVVICTERYLAIIHPIRCKQILTRNRLRIVIILVWVISSAYAMPRYIISHTISNPLSDSSEIICIMSRIRYNSKAFDVINFFLLYLLPLGVMLVLYSLIAVRLWNSDIDYPSVGKCRSESIVEESSIANCTMSSLEDDNPSGVEQRKSVCNTKIAFHGCHYSTNKVPASSRTRYRSSKNVLQSRRRVIRMLIVIVLAFAVCNLPFHARKMWQYWSKHYDGVSTFSSLFTPITFLCTYCNSAINPLLYAFFSKNFQKSFKEFLTCPWKRRG